MNTELNKHRFIVFGEEHYNPLGIIRSLGEEGFKVVLVVIDGSPAFISKSRYISDVHHVKDREQGLSLLLSTYIDIENPAFLYVCDDTSVSLLDSHYNELKDKFYFFNAGGSNRIEPFLNKKTIGELASRHGLNFLKAIVVEKGITPEGLSYPIITKAIDSTANGWKKDMHVCNNEDELKVAFETIQSKQVMIQEYIIKKNEYCLEGFCCNHGSDLFISIQSTYNYLLPMSYSPFMTVNNFSNMNNVFPSLQAMFQEIGYEGIFEIEFLIANDDSLYFSEINFRNSTWSYASTCGGMNLPVLWAKSMLSGYRKDECYHTIENPGFTAMVELTDFKERVIKQKYPLLKWVRDLCNCKCKYYIGHNDLKPVVALLMSRIKPSKGEKQIVKH